MSSIVIARDVSFEFSNGRSLFSHLSFSLDARLSALVGSNGVGKTSLARIIAGDLEPTHGVVRRNTSVGLIPQRQDPPAMTVAEFLSDEYEWSLPGERLLARTDRYALCNQLSGGEWMRVRLARALDQKFLILDEPTNNLDLKNIEFLERIISSFSGAVIVVSHDDEFLRHCALQEEFTVYAVKG